MIFSLEKLLIHKDVQPAGTSMITETAQVTSGMYFLWLPGALLGAAFEYIYFAKPIKQMFFKTAGGS